MKDEQFYYNYLLKTFGGIELLGLNALAYALVHYEGPNCMMKIFTEYAEKIHSTPSAVERSVRTYFKKIMRDYTMEDLERILGYKFRPNQKYMRAYEFVPMLKYILEQEEQAQSQEAS